jgi:hypothetical protein
MTAEGMPSNENRIQPGSDSCETPIERNAPAGSKGSLGSKSDCNGRPSTDDSVVEAKDEMGPGLAPPASE